MEAKTKQKILKSRLLKPPFWNPHPNALSPFPASLTPISLLKIPNPHLSITISLSFFLPLFLSLSLSLPVSLILCTFDSHFSLSLPWTAEPDLASLNPCTSTSNPALSLASVILASAPDLTVSTPSSATRSPFVVLPRLCRSLPPIRHRRPPPIFRFLSPGSTARAILSARNSWPPSPSSFSLSLPPRTRPISSTP